MAPRLWQVMRISRPESARQLSSWSQSATGTCQAREHVSGLGSYALGKIIWLEAVIRRDCGQYARAEESLEEVVDIFRPISPQATALATTDLVKTLLLHRRAKDAYRTAMTMLQLIEPLRSNKIASAAIADLLRIPTNPTTVPGQRDHLPE